MYIPVSQREKPATKSVYVPVAKRPETAVTEPPTRPTLSFNPVSTPQVAVSTPAILTQEKDPNRIMGKFAAEVGQGIARNIGSAGLTVSGAVQRKVAEPLQAEDFQSFFGQALFETVFGKGQPVKPIETRIAEAEPKIKQWQEDLAKLADNPELNKRERLVVNVLSNLDNKSLAFIGIFGSVGLDITPLGSSEKAAFLTLKNIKKADQAASTLLRMGVPEDLAKFYADDVVKIATDKEAADFLTNLEKQLKTTQPKNVYKPVAQRRIEDLTVVPTAEESLEIAARQAGVDEPGVIRVPKDEPVLRPIPKDRKYKSAEEFIKAQGEQVFRGGDKSFDKTLIGEDGVFVTPSKFMAETFGKKVDELYIKPNAKILSYNDLPASIKAIDNWDEYSEAVSKYGREKGVDVIDSLPAKPDFPRGMERTVLNPDVIQTKSQLTDLYNRATLGPQSKNLPTFPKRTNLKLEERATQALSFDEFARRSGVSEETLNATAKAKGYKDAKDFYNKNHTKKLETRAKQKAKKIETSDSNRNLDTKEVEIKKTEARKTLKGGKQAKDESRNTLENELLAVEFAKEAVEANPARQLSKYSPRRGDYAGSLPEVTGIGPSEFARRGDDIVTELGFDNTEQAREAFLQYRKDRERLLEMLEAVRAKTKDYRDTQKVLEALKQDIKQEGENRQRILQATRDFFKFSTNEWNRILRRLKFQDPRLYSDAQFDEFMDKLKAEAEATFQAMQRRIEIKAIIYQQEFKKVDNLLRALKLPNIENMTASQLDLLDEMLAMYKTGDEFLTLRQLETIKNTDIYDIRTTREALEKLAKDAGASVEDLNKVKYSWVDRYRYDTALARQNPFYNVMVLEKDAAFLKAQDAVLRMKMKMDELFRAARKSRKRGLLDRLVPTDKKIFEWLEGDALKKSDLAEEMTAQELEAAWYVRNLYAQARDYLVQKEVLKRYKSDYITHIRRGFLEAWRDDGLLKAISNSFDQYKQDEAIFNILNSKTGEILPLEKFFQFSMKRFDQITPTKNVPKAVLAYMGAFEKKAALDSIVPKIDIYAHSLTPRLETPRGLEFDATLKNFVKEWLNTKKGRVIDTKYVQPGGSLDWALRTSMALVRMIDLGFSVPVGVAAAVGEQATTFALLGAKDMAKGTARLATPQGRRILKRYQGFVGESTLEKLRETAAGPGDKLQTGIFTMFTEATRLANKQYLLGSLSPQEWKSGIIEPKRLAELKRDMGRYRVVEEAESVLGKTAPLKALGQYKKWAVPIFSTTVNNLKTVGKAIKEDGIKKALSKKETKELFRSAVLSASVALALGGYAESLKDKKNKNFAETLLSKAYRDALTLVGVFDPRFWTSEPRLLSFTNDLAEALTQIVTLEKYEKGGTGYKKGDLKGIEKLKQTVTPKAINQFLPAKQKKAGPAGNLPKIPKPPKRNLPKLPKPPKIPKPNI